MPMHHQLVTEVVDPGPWKLSRKVDNTFYAMIVIGAILWGIGFSMNPLRGWSAYLINFLFVMFLALSGTFFTSLEYITGTKWSPAIRRIPEGISTALPLSLIFILVLALGVPKLFTWYSTWTNAEGLTRAVARTKVTWLSQPFFTIRDFFFIVLWIILGTLLVKNSRKQDGGNAIHLSKINNKLSIAFILIYALSFSIASYDLLMSLEPNWYSTMFGVYTFIGMFESGIALIAIIAIKMKQSGTLPLTSKGHIRDLGALMFAMAVFMSYIGFCQFLLIWYANLPDETFYFNKRIDNGWWIIFVLFAILKFIIPFVFLMSQAAKRNERRLIVVAVMILLGQWFDLYWMVIPTKYSELTFPGIADIGGLLFFVGLFGIPVVRTYRKYSVLPTGDPKILTSLNWNG